MIDVAAEQTKLDNAKQRLAAAQAAHADAQRALLASDGRTPIYGEAEHAKRTAAVTEAFTAKAAAIGETADAVTAAIEGARLSPHADPMVTLGILETDTALRYREFVKEDCLELLSVPDLVNRLQWVRARGDKGLLALYGRYAGRRYQILLDAKPQPAGLSELHAELVAMGAIGPTRGMSPELQRLQENAAHLKRLAQAASRGPNGRGTGQPLGI